jgi:hypothetical protein
MTPVSNPTSNAMRRAMSTTVQRFSVLLCLGITGSAAALSGCAAFDKGHLAPRVASQVMVSRLDPPPGCEFLGEVKGVAPLGDLIDANGDVLRNAVLRGGNYVTVDLVERPVLLGLGSYVVRGRLFACAVPAPAGAVQAFAAPRPAALPGPPGDADAPRGCEPECATGFSCQLGACVQAPAPQAAAPQAAAPQSALPAN